MMSCRACAAALPANAISCPRCGTPHLQAAGPTNSAGISARQAPIDFFRGPTSSSGYPLPARFGGSAATFSPPSKAPSYLLPSRFGTPPATALRPPAVESFPDVAAPAARQDGVYPPAPVIAPVPVLPPASLWRRRPSGALLPTVLTVLIPILLGGFYQLFFHDLQSGKHHIGNQTMGRYILVGTVAFYVVVALIIIGRRLSATTQMRWTQGSALTGALIGLGTGGALGLLAVFANSAASGHLATDPNATFLTSEGDLPHILTTLLLLSIAAPLVEETLFRGILMEWLRPVGATAAFIVSAAAFAVWHYRFSELRYYAMMGVILGLLYWKRGLVASMTAHATFNGVLAVTAVVLALTPSAVVRVGDLSFVKPQGWHQIRAMSGDEEFEGPSGAMFDIASAPGRPVSETAKNLLIGLKSDPTDQLVNGFATNLATASIVSSPVGDVLRVPIGTGDSTGEADFVVTPSAIDTLIFLTSGSAKAQKAISQVRASLRFAP